MRDIWNPSHLTTLIAPDSFQGLSVAEAAEVLRRGEQRASQVLKDIASILDAFPPGRFHYDAADTGFSAAYVCSWLVHRMSEVSSVAKNGRIGYLFFVDSTDLEPTKMSNACQGSDAIWRQAQNLFSSLEEAFSTSMLGTDKFCNSVEILSMLVNIAINYMSTALCLLVGIREVAGILPWLN